MHGLSNPVRGGLLLAASSLALSGCLLSPGAFTSELHLMKDGNFSYSYDGQIQMLALTKLAEMSEKTDSAFLAECWDEDTDEERECSAEEIAEQQAEWELAEEQREANRKKEAEEMKAVLGGIDPSDPDAAKELAERLERQRGWEKVDYLGDGLFDVDFRISGPLSHDFAFPMIEKVPMTNVFVTVYLRDNGQVRVDAPGFASQPGGSSALGLVGGFNRMAFMDEFKNDDGTSKVVRPDGTFTIITDGRILANNTDEGPSARGSAKALSWSITPRTQQAPTALIAFD